MINYNKNIKPLICCLIFILKIPKCGVFIISFRFPWPRLKPLLVSKLDEVMKHFNQEVPGDHFPMCPNVENVRYDDMRSRILASLDSFHGYTIIIVARFLFILFVSADARLLRF